MDFNNIIDYQKKDSEAIKLEKQLQDSKYKKNYTQMVNMVKEMQNKTAVLEKEAASLAFDYSKIDKSYKDNISSFAKILKKKVENATEKELETLNEFTSQLTSNLNILEKKLLSQAEQVNKVLIEFNNSKKSYDNARMKYTENKKLYDEEVKNIEPILTKIKAELKELEKNIDSRILEKYNARRQDKIFPIFVPLTDKTCGGCRMELPSNMLETIKKNGFLECEHCRRVIYTK